MKTKTDQNPEPDPHGTNAMALRAGTVKTDLNKVYREFCERIGVPPDQKADSATHVKTNGK